MFRRIGVGETTEAWLLAVCLLGVGIAALMTTASPFVQYVFADCPDPENPCNGVCCSGECCSTGNCVDGLCCPNDGTTYFKCGNTCCPDGYYCCDGVCQGCPFSCGPENPCSCGGTCIDGYCQ